MIVFYERAQRVKNFGDFRLRWLVPSRLPLGSFACHHVAPKQHCCIRKGKKSASRRKARKKARTAPLTKISASTCVLTCDSAAENAPGALLALAAHLVIGADHVARIDQPCKVAGARQQEADDKLQPATEAHQDAKRRDQIRTDELARCPHGTRLQEEISRRPWCLALKAKWLRIQ